MNELQTLTRSFGIAIIRHLKSERGDMIDQVLARQLVRSATSVGANYRAACRPRSGADMIAKLKIVEEECDESLYWLDMMKEAGSLSHEAYRELTEQADHILRMTVKSIKTLRAKSTKKPK